MSILLSWLVLSLSVWIAALVLPGFRIKKFGDALVVALIFGLANFLLGQLLFVLLAVATLGLGLLLSFLTRLIVDVLLLKLTAAFTSRVEINSFGTTFLAALIIALLSGLGELVLRKLL